MSIYWRWPIFGRETMRKKKVGAIAIKSFAVLVVLGSAYRAMLQDAATPYSTMASIEQYLMDRTPRSCWLAVPLPKLFSRDATVLVLGRHGYDTALQGKNGWVWLGGTRMGLFLIGPNSGTRKF